MDEALHLRILHRLQRGRRQAHRLLAQQGRVAGASNHCERRSAGSCLRISATSEGTSRNLSRTKVPRLRPMRSWLRAITAVCGMGSPSGPAKQGHHGKPVGQGPTMAASAMALMQLSSRPRSTRLVATKRP